MTDEEVKVVDALSLNIREYKSKIWDIFWHNIIKKELLTPNLVKDIEDVIPSKNIIEYDGKFIFSLPLECDEYINSKEKLHEYKEKLRKIFRDNNLIMYQG